MRKLYERNIERFRVLKLGQAPSTRPTLSANVSMKGSRYQTTFSNEDRIQSWPRISGRKSGRRDYKVYRAAILIAIAFRAGETKF